MRIVGGEWRSRVIAAPASGLRPTADRLREAVFNILANVLDFEECTVCDLFAGSGAMGIEGLSRGARFATFVEEQQATATVIEKNLRTLGAEERGSVIVGDAFEFVANSDETFDIIFADPPYAYEQLDEFVALVLDRKLFKTIFVVEHAAAITIHSGTHTPWKQRRFGASAVTIFYFEEP